MALLVSVCTSVLLFFLSRFCFSKIQQNKKNIHPPQKKINNIKKMKEKSDGPLSLPAVLRVRKSALF